MKKVIMSLIISGLSVSDGCFAMVNNAIGDKNFGQSNNLRQIKVDSTWSKVKSNAKKVLRNKKVRVALGVAGTAVAFGLGYKYSSSFQDFVDKGSEFVGSKLSDLISNIKGRSENIPVTDGVCNPYPFVEKSPVSAWSNVWGRGFVEDVTDGVCNPYPSIKKPAVSDWSSMWGRGLVEEQPGNAWNSFLKWASKFWNPEKKGYLVPDPSISARSNVWGRGLVEDVTDGACNPYPSVEKSPVSAWSNVWGRGFVEDVTDGVCNPYPSIKKPAVSALWENGLDSDQCSLILKNVPDYCKGNVSFTPDFIEKQPIDVLLKDFRNSEEYYEKLGNFATSAVDTVKAAVNSFVFLGLIYGLSR